MRLININFSKKKIKNINESKHHENIKNLKVEVQILLIYISWFSKSFFFSRTIPIHQKNEFRKKSPENLQEFSSKK
jgi:hypothetical protein